MTMKETPKKKAAWGDRVTVHYIGTLDNGAIFDSRDSNDPLTLILGENSVFPALEQQICGMYYGQTKNIQIPAAQAYGQRNNDNLLKVDRAQFPADRPPEVGKLLTITFADGEERIMRICACNDEQITLDANHPLAGLDLTFALTLLPADD